MASTRRFFDNVLDKLKLVEDITYTEIDGNYLLFVNGLEFGGVYDDKFVVYITKRAHELVPYAKEVEVLRYGKNITCLHINEIGNRTVLKELVNFLIKDIKAEKEVKENEKIK